MRPILVVVTTMAGALGLSACEPRTGNPAGGIDCQVLADAPRRDSDEAPRRIVGRARFWCDRPGPRRLSITVTLQQRVAPGEWVEIAREDFGTGGRPTTRTSRARHRFRTISVPCAEGIFRTTVAARSVDRGVVKRYTDTSAQFAEPCRALFAG